MNTTLIRICRVGLLLVCVAMALRPVAAAAAAAGGEGEVRDPPVIDENLLARYITEPAGTRIPVLISMDEQPSLEWAHEEWVRELPRRERRRLMISYMRGRAGATQGDVLAVLAGEVARGGARNIRPLWLINAVGASIDLDAALAVAELPEVAWIAAADVEVHLMGDPPACEECPEIDCGTDPEDEGACCIAGGEATCADEPVYGSVENCNDEDLYSCGVVAIGADRVHCELIDAEENPIIGDGVIVAIIDATMFPPHTDYAGRMWVNTAELSGDPDVDDDNNGYVDDVNGWDFSCDASVPRVYPHANVIAGMVGGDGTGGIHTGVAPGATLMGVGLVVTSFGFDSSDLVVCLYALQYAVDNGADVISASWGVFPASVQALSIFSSFRAAMDYIIALEVVPVFAAGNGGMVCTSGYGPPDNVILPASCPDVIAVGSVSCGGELFCLSARGPSVWSDYPAPDGVVKPDIVAPSNLIATWTCFDGGATCWPSPSCIVDLTGAGSYYFCTDSAGTSFATPHVAGVAALMLQADPTLTPLEIKAIMENTAVCPGVASKNNTYGAGMVDAFAAVCEALDQAGIQCP